MFGGETIPFAIAKGWLKRLYDELLRIGSKRKVELQRIKDNYGDPTYLARFYVQPDCQQFNPADDNEDESSVVVREPIIQRIEAYLSGSAVHSRNQLFILSDAGMGKTSLLVMLKLADLSAFWPKGYECELLKLGPGTLDEVAKIPNKSNTVLLLDALDEDPLAWGNIEGRLGDILRATTHFRRVLITCRSQFFSAGDDPFNKRGNVEVSGFLCPVIYNSLFTDEQTEEYLTRRAEEHRSDSEWLNNAKQIVRGMGSLRMRPMLLAHVDDFLDANETRWTEYTIYRALIRSWLLREQRKIGSKQDSRPSVEDLWVACRQLAIFLNSNGQVRLSETDLKRLVQSFPHVANIPFMHIGGRSLLNKGLRATAGGRLGAGKSLCVASAPERVKALRSAPPPLRSGPSGDTLLRFGCGAGMDRERSFRSWERPNESWRFPGAVVISSFGAPAPVDQNQLFALALGLTEPWYVASLDFSAEDKRLEIGIDFRRGGTFPCPECGAGGCKAYDTEQREWRHLNFFQHQTILRARVPRIDCNQCGVRPVNVPWSRPGSGFTLLFEALVLAMAAHMPVRAIARLVGEHDTRLWRIIHHYVDTARGQRDDSGVRNVGIDDKSVRRGHDYVTVFADLDERKVLFVADGRKGEAIEQFRWDLIEHGADPDQVAEICLDMSAAYIAGVENSFPRAAITFDRFHVMKLLSEAIEKTRREEQKSAPELKGHRLALLKNPESMRDDELEFAAALLSRRSSMKTAKAFHLRLSFQDFYAQPARAAERFLRSWCSWASRSRVPEMVRVARTLRKHAAGVLRWFTSRITNGLLEAINSLIQSAKARARGFRTTNNLKAIIYLIAGKLDLQSTH